HTARRRARTAAAGDGDDPEADDLRGRPFVAASQVTPRANGIGSMGKGRGGRMQPKVESKAEPIAAPIAAPNGAPNAAPNGAANGAAHGAANGAANGAAHG